MNAASAPPQHNRKCKDRNPGGAATTHGAPWGRGQWLRDEIRKAEKMDVEQIQAKLTEAHSLYVERAGKQPYCGMCQITICAQGKPMAFLWGESSDDQLEGRADTIGGALDDLISAIRTMPTGEEKALRDFQRKLAEVIDMGHASGIPVEFMNPVVETARKLAENAITDERVSA